MICNVLQVDYSVEANSDIKTFCMFPCVSKGARPASSVVHAFIALGVVHVGAGGGSSFVSCVGTGQGKDERTRVRGRNRPIDFGQMRMSGGICGHGESGTSTQERLPCLCVIIYSG